MNEGYAEIFVEKHNAFLNKDGTPNDTCWQAQAGLYQYRLATPHFKTREEAFQKLNEILAKDKKIEEYKNCKQYWYDKYNTLVKQLRGIDLDAFISLVDIAEGALESMEFDDHGICGRYDAEALKLGQLIKELNNVK